MSTLQSEPREAREAAPSTLVEARRLVSLILRIVQRRRWLFFVPCCVAATGAFLVSLTLPRRYAITTTFERRDDPVLLDLLRMRNAEYFANLRASMLRDVKDEQLMSDVVEELGLVNHVARESDGSLTPAGRAEARAIGARLAGLVQIDFPGPKADHLDTIRMTYDGPDPNLGAAVVNTMRDAFVNRMQHEMSSTLLQGARFHNAEADALRATIDALELDLLDGKMKHPGIDPTDPDTIYLKLTALESRKEQLLRDQRDAEAAIEAREAFLSGKVAVPPSPIEAQAPRQSGDSDAVRRIRQDMATIQRQIADLKFSRGMTDLHPDVIALRRTADRQAGLLEQALADATGAGLMEPQPGPDAGSLAHEAQKAQTRIELTTFRGQLERIDREIQTCQADIASYEELQAGVADKRQAYRAKQEDLGRAREDYVAYRQVAQRYESVLAVQDRGRGTTFRVISAARPSDKPSSPRTEAVLFVCLFIGLVTGGALVLLVEMFDQTYHTAPQIAASLGVPLLAAVDFVMPYAQRRRLFLRRLLLGPLAATALIAIVLASGSLAYLSLEGPATYQRMTHTNPGERTWHAESAQPDRLLTDSAT